MFLVALDLALQLVDQGLHPLVVLLVLVPSESKLLDGSLGLAEVLQDVIVAPGLGVQLALQLPDASLLNYPSGVEPGHPGLQARPVTSPRAIGQRQMVPAVNCKENAPVSQARLAPPSLLIGQNQTA